MKKIIQLIIIAFSVVLFAQNDKIKFDKFLGKKAKVVIVKEYTFSKLYDYKINSQDFDSIAVKPYFINIPEKVLTKKYLTNLQANKKDSILFALNLSYKLSIDIQGKRYIFIKYRVLKENQKEKYQVLIVSRENSIWVEHIPKKVELNLIKSVLLNSSINLLYEFYNTSNNPKYPEINKLKSATKSGNLLDIIKLEKVLRENQSTLKKYLDN